MSNQQPQQPGFFDRNTIMAIVLSFTVFFLWKSYMARRYPPAPTVTAAAGDVAPSGPQTNSGIKKPAPGTADTSAPNVQKPAADFKEEILTFESEQVRFDLSSNGMGIKSLVLKKFTDRKNNPVTYNQEQFPPLIATTVNGADQFQISKTGDNEFTGRLQNDGVEITK
jgi:YidC/Oxa1 family membrane protein insertase